MFTLPRHDERLLRLRYTSSSFCQVLCLAKYIRNILLGRLTLTGNVRLYVHVTAGTMLVTVQNKGSSPSDKHLMLGFRDFHLSLLLAIISSSPGNPDIIA